MKIYTLAEIFDQIGRKEYRESWHFDAIGCLVIENRVPGYVADNDPYRINKDSNLFKLARDVKDKMLHMIKNGTDFEVRYYEHMETDSKRLSVDVEIEDIYIPGSYLIFDHDKNHGWLKCEIHEEENFLEIPKHEGRMPKWDWENIHLEIQKCLYDPDKKDWSIRLIAKHVAEKMKGKQNMGKTNPGNENSTPSLREVEKAVSKFYNLKKEMLKTSN